MLGFGAHPASVDWSFFGGLEELPPHLHGTVPTRATQRAAAAKAAAAATTAAAKAAAADRPEASATSSAAAPRPAASAYRPYVRGGGDLSSESASSDSDAPPAATGTPPTSDEEEATRPAALPVQTDWKAQERMREQMKKGVQASQLGLVADAEEAKRRGALPAGYPWVPKKADTPPPTDDFLWLLTEEPHRSRRWAILKAHPEVKSLMGYEPLTKWVSGFVTLLQIGVGIGLSYSGWSWLDWRLLLLTYVVGATATHNLFLAIHEITHNLAFRSIDANRTWSIVTNLPIGIPYAMMFKRYHMEHHKYMGEDGIDTDLPSRLELWCLNNVLGKAFFATFQILFYALRPGFIRSQRLTSWHVLNIGTVILFDVFIARNFGFTPLYYFLLSAFLAGSWHPCAGHFIAEHYLFGGIQQETWSYYGPLNWFTYNVGYHNEHHDFPSVAWTKLPTLRRMCPEFYDCLPQHTSWPLVTAQFVFGTDSGIWARVKRSRTMGDQGVPEE